MATVFEIKWILSFGQKSWNLLKRSWTKLIWYGFATVQNSAPLSSVLPTSWHQKFQSFTRFADCWAFAGLRNSRERRSQKKSRRAEITRRILNNKQTKQKQSCKSWEKWGQSHDSWHDWEQSRLGVLLLADCLWSECWFFGRVFHKR